MKKQNSHLKEINFKKRSTPKKAAFCYSFLITTSLLVHISQPTFSTVMAVKMVGHESPSSTFSIRALLPQPLNFPRIINLVELKHSKLDLLLLVLNLLGLCIGLLLPLLGSTTKTKHQVESRFLLDVVIGECTAVLELFSGEDQALLIWGNPFLVLNLRLDIVDGV